MVKIVTDTSTLFTVESGREIGLESIPLCVSIGSWNGRDLSMDMAEFYGKIHGGEIPSSSQPPIGEVLDAYERFSGYEIINITMAEGLSGTYESACSARDMAENKEDISVFNSKTLCGPHRYMAKRAQEMADAGAGREEILKWLEMSADSTESFLIPQDFSFLRRGGRLTPVAAAIGSLLKLKPILKLTEDGMRLDKFKIKRTISSAVESMIHYLQNKKMGADQLLYISHANVLEDAKKIKNEFEKIFPELEICIMELSPAFVTQGGPKCVAIQYIDRN